MIEFLFKQKNKINKGRKILSEAKGFTLVETLVAVAIFTVSITALMATLASGISNTTYAKEKITATYLAQEGIEYMRNMRDDYVLYPANGGWNSFVAKIYPCTVTSCYFKDQDLGLSQMKDITIDKCVGTNTCHLYYVSSGAGEGKYTYDSSDVGTVSVDSGFIRTITVNPSLNGGQEMKVTSTVSWKQGSGNYYVSLSENLFNWTEQP